MIPRSSVLYSCRGGARTTIPFCCLPGASLTKREIYNLPVNLFNFPVKQEKRCINPPLRAGDRVRVRVRVS